ncbi:hypothetical protein C8Q80DRAFT_529883 [Daedaleopsis nitida]|nr:hypothetical protein C8Q80DRAFT_529883 [Daedaleopsis nitida]
MSCATISPSFIFPTATATPHAFNLFATMQSPRDTYHMYEDARRVLHSSNGRIGGRKSSSGSFKHTQGLKKIFGL